jgi:hypothetical protein
MLRRLVQPGYSRSYFAGPAKKGKKGGGAATAEKAGGIGDFPMDEMYPELKLGELQESDLPAWVNEVADEVLADAAKAAPAPGEEDRKYFKLQRREKIKQDNERRSLGV